MANLPRSLIILAALSACAPPNTVELRSEAATVKLELEPFALSVANGKGELLRTLGTPGGTFDYPKFKEQLIPGWDGYTAREQPWRFGGAKAKLLSQSKDAASVELTDGSWRFVLDVSVDGERVRLRSHVESGDDKPPHKTSLSFALPPDEHFFGLGERYASTDHRGLSLYT